MSTTYNPLIYYGFRVKPNETAFEYAVDAEKALPKGVTLYATERGWNVAIEKSVVEKAGLFTLKLSGRESWFGLLDKAAIALGIQVDQAKLVFGWYADVSSY
jgi:hypothetical protein